ncbi:MAG: ABC transporter ATP-binding protein [Planctomycetota bacterium]
MIELIDITKIYPMGASEVRAMDGVSLRFEEGEFVAIIGASGSGKSTMLHLLGCLDRPTTGSYRFLGETVSGLSDRQLARIRNRSIGFVFQTFNLISRMSAWENVAVPLFYARQTVTKPGALEALERVGLADRATHQPSELSGGERQRVAIARAIVNQPRLILADEPTGNLDSKTGEQIMSIFRDLHAAGTTIILVTHERDIADQTQRRVYMRDGKIIEDHSTSRVSRASPAEASGHEPQQPVAPAEPVAGGTAGISGWSTETASPATAAEAPDTVLHPNAKRALIWTLLGPACAVGLVGWVQLLKLLQQANPGFVGTIGRALLLVLMAMIFVAPVLGFLHGRKGARWVRLAPARFTGLRRALIAQWVAGIHLILATSILGLLVVVAWAAARAGWGPR